MYDEALDAEDFWAGVPSITEPLPQRGSAGSRLFGRGATPIVVKRRTVLRSAAVLGGALALNVLQTIPPSRTRRASAVAGSEYTNCANYDNWSGYNNNSKLCVGGPYSSNYCGSDKWFLTYSDSWFASWPVKACGNGLPKRNAWRWLYGGRIPGAPYRCADGYQQSRRGTPVFRICSARL